MYKCRLRNATTDEHFAMKIVRPGHDSNIENEEAALTACRSNQHIVNLKRVYHDDIFTYFIMELLVGHSLLDQIGSHLTERMVRNYFRQMVCGLQAIHARQYVHRDLVPGNFMFADQGTNELRILDLSCAIPVHTPTLSQFPLMPLHTPQFAPPEAFHNGAAAFSGDVWSLGAILYLMLCDDPPFLYDQGTLTIEENLQRSIDFIQCACYNNSSPTYLNISPTAKLLIHALLKEDPLERLTLDQLLQHHWMLN